MGLKCFQYIDPSCRLVVFYGATEAMSEVSWEVFSDEHELKEKMYGQQLPIGLPLYNTTIYIMDEDFNIVPEGTIGEVSGDNNSFHNYKHLF
jgi:non-ribosomal peptide synthetase component F